jgi:predicted TIM-barrel fold metal-dependent hydrolase
MYKIIDIHTHTYPETISEKAVRNLAEFYEFNVDGKGTYADLEAEGKKAGIGGFLILTVATNSHQVTKVNDTTAAITQLSRQNGFETVGFAGMHQDYPDMEGEIDRIIGLGLSGIKIHPDIQRVDINSPKLIALCEIIEGRLPLYLHMGDERPEYRYSEPKKLAALLDRFPKLEVVAAHLGGYMVWDEAVSVLAGRPNVWFDTSSALWAMTPEKAVELIHAYGSDRVMFGTDYPVKKLDDELSRFLKLDLTETERENILYYNAKRFLKI